MDAEDKRMDCMLAQLDEFQAKFMKERKSMRLSLNAATARIKDLERDLAQSQTTNDTLTDMIGKLQSKLEDYMKEIDSPSLPFVTNTQEISSSNEDIGRQSHSTDSANSQDVNSIRRSPNGEDETINHTNDDKAVDNHDVGVPKENQPQLETVSESVPNTEIVIGTDGISSYFSNFYIDPQTIHSDENLVISTIPPAMRMVLSSYERFDKRYLVFVIEEPSGGSKDCHFLSIDDLLTLPENADLVQQLENGKSTSPDGQQNLSLFTVLGQLIARMSPAIAKSVEEESQQQMLDNQTQIKTEEKPVVNKRSKTSVKKKNRAAKKKPSYVCVSEEDTDVDIADFTASDSDTHKKDSRIKCKVCEIEKQEVKCFKNRALLDQHLLQTHPFSTFPTYLRCPYGDDECTRHYLKKHALNLHIKSCHPDATSSVALSSTPKLKSWICTYCGNEFLSSRIFLKHMNESHTGFAETVTLTQSSKLRGHCKLTTKPKSPKKSTRLSNKRKRSSVSVSRKSSLSDSDDDYYPDEDSMPSTSSKRGHPHGTKSRKRENSPEPDEENVLVIKAEIHREDEPIEQAETSSSQKVSSFKCTDRKDPTRQEKQPIPSTSTADPTDINEFVLSSVYEISSIFEKQEGAATSLPAPMDLPSWDSPVQTKYHTLETVKDPERFTLTNYASTYQSSHYSVPPSLPCLLDDCTGCDFHPKQTIVNLTLDDEFVSSCRDEILADLYSIPNDPPMVTGSFSAALSSKFESDSVQKTTSNGEKRDVENVNVKSSSFVDNHDIANVIIAEDQCDRRMRDIANVIINDDEITKPASIETRSDQIDSDHTSLPEDSNKKASPTENDQCNQKTTEDEVTQMNKKDGTGTNENIHTENASPLVEDGNKNESVANEEKSIEGNNQPVETGVIENQNRTANGLGDNPVCHDSPSTQEDHFKNGETPSADSNTRICPDRNLVSCEENEKEQSADDNTGIEESTSPIANEILTPNEDSPKMLSDSTPSEPETNLDQNLIPCEENRKEKSTEFDNTGTEESICTSSKARGISTSNEDSSKVCMDPTPSEPETNLEQDLISCDENQKKRTTEIDTESMEESTAQTVNEISTPSENPLDMSTNSTPSDSERNLDRNRIFDDEHREEETAKVDSGDTDEANSSIANEMSTSSEDPHRISTDSTPSESEINLDRNRISGDENQEEQITYVDIEATAESSPSITNEISTSTKDPLGMDEKLSTDFSPAVSEHTVDQIGISGDGLESNDTILPTSALLQNNILIVEDRNKSPQSSNDHHISPNSTPETISINSDKIENHTQINFVTSATKKSFHKSIFEPDYEKNPVTPNRDQIPDFDTSLHVNELTPPVIDEEESNSHVNSSNTRETALVSKEHDHELIESAPFDEINKVKASGAGHDETQPKHRDPPVNGISSPPPSPKSKQSIDNFETLELRTSPSCNLENCNTSLDDTSPNPPISNNNSTYFDEFGQSSICEIKSNTSDSVANQPSTPKCHEISPMMRKLLSRPSSVRCTNEIIEGIGIEIEVDSSSSTHSSPGVCKDFNNVPLSSTNDTSTNDTSVETSLQPDTESAPPETLEFALIVKRMLNKTTLGHCSNEIVEGIEMVINTSSVSRSSTPDSFQSSTLSNSAIDKESDSIGTPKDIATEANSCEVDMVPVVDSVPPQISHFSEDNQEKDDFESGIVHAAESPAYFSSVEKDARNQDGPNQCSLVDTTHQPDQSHHSVKFNPQPMETIEGNSSPLITSSNCSEKMNIDYFVDSITRSKLLNLTVLVPRLMIDQNRSISAKYHLRRKKQTIPNATLDYLTSTTRVKSKGKRVYRCNICGEIFLKALLLRNHLGSEHIGNEGTITCSICGFVSQSRNTLSTHRKNRHNLFYTNFVKCIICNNKVLYDSSEALNAHIHQTHPNPHPYYTKCPHGEGECTWYFDRVEEFREHVEDFHENEDLSVSRENIFLGETTWRCSLCGKIYSCDRYLSDHHIKDHNQ